MGPTRCFESGLFLILDLLLCEAAADKEPEKGPIGPGVVLAPPPPPPRETRSGRVFRGRGIAVRPQTVCGPLGPVPLPRPWQQCVVPADFILSVLV